VINDDDLTGAAHQRRPTPDPLASPAARVGPAAPGYRRRDALALSGLAGLAGLAAAACGTQNIAAPPPAPPQNTLQRFWARQRRHGHVNFANWPLYIDPGHETLRDFTGATGITVSYAEVIQENESWFSEISPILRAGESIGYDIMVVTDGFQFSELVTAGDLTPLDQRRMPNFYRYARRRFRNRSFDPGNTYSMPWAGGATGIAWNPTYIKKPVTSINELWNPAYKGRVGMMSDILDLGNFGMIKLGINPETSGPNGWHRAARELAAQRDAGLVRGYYEQEYIDALSKGDTWISMAWSGDVFLQNLSSGTDLRFVIPREGGNMWTDNMMIPRRAQNPVDAMMLMDWYYRPEIAAMLTEAINFIPPVPAAQPVIAAAAAKATGSQKELLTKVASSHLVFLPPHVYTRLSNYADVSGKRQQQYLSIFQPVIAG
jgi:spermidine/putrescine transport system substrate-binding protein